MKTTTDITLEIETLRNELRALQEAFESADEYQQSKLTVKGNILKARIKALKIALDMKEHNGKRINL